MQTIRRVRRAQPQFVTGLDPKWVKRGLVLAILPEWYATPQGVFPIAKYGTPATLSAVDGRVSAFGSAFAGNSNSYLAGPTLPHPKSGWRSVFVRLYAASTGGGGVGRIFQATVGTGVDGTGGEALYPYITGGELLWTKWNYDTWYSQYKSPAPIPLNTWVSYGLTHDQRVGDTVPQGYKNGSPETWLLATSNGANNLSSAPGTVMAIGNRPSDLLRSWDGMLGIQLYFDGKLSSADHAALHANPSRVFRGRTLSFSAPTAQYARPTSDVTTGAWVSSLGGSLAAAIDEAIADDADYIGTTYGSICEVALGSLADPGVSSGHKVRYRIAADAGAIIVRLRQGATTIASWTHNPAPTSLTTYEQTLSGAEADSITDYSALKLQFEAY